MVLPACPACPACPQCEVCTKLPWGSGSPEEAWSQAEEWAQQRDQEDQEATNGNGISLRHQHQRHLAHFRVPTGPYITLYPKKPCIAVGWSWTLMKFRLNSCSTPGRPEFCLWSLQAEFAAIDDVGQ